jgi:hypothetical protein
MASLAVVPRADVQRKSGTFDRSDGYARRLIAWRDSLLRQGMEEMRSWKDLQEIDQTIAYLEGSFYDANRPAYRSSYVDNYLADMRREALSSLSQIRPTIDVTSSVKEYKQQAETVHKYIRALWFKQNLDMTVVDWIDHALFGTGFLKHVAGENVFQFSAHGADQVIPVLCNGQLQESVAVIYQNYKPLPYFYAKFGKEKCEGLERYTVNLSRSLSQDKYVRPSSVPEYTWNAMSPAMKRRMSMRGGPVRESEGTYVPFPVIELKEVYFDDWSINESGNDEFVQNKDLHPSEYNYHYIVPPGARLFPRKRLAIFAGDRIMYDGPSPFWHGLYPFTMLQLNPCVWSPGGISKYRDIIPQNKAINRIGAGVEEATARAMNMNVIGKRGAIPDAAWDSFQPAKPAQKIQANPIYQKGDMAYMDPPILPSYVGEFLRYNVETIKKRSGSLDISGLAKKKQVPGGEAIEQMRETMSGPFQLESRYVEVALEQAGEQMVSNIFQYATLSGRMQILGVDGETPEDFDYNAGTMVPSSAPKESHWRTFSMKIAPGSTHGMSKMQKKVEAFTMFKAGALSMAGLYRQTEFPENVDAVQKEMLAEHEKGIGGAPKGAGRQPRQNRSQRTGSPL